MCEKRGAGLQIWLQISSVPLKYICFSLRDIGKTKKGKSLTNNRACDTKHFIIIASLSTRLRSVVLHVNCNNLNQRENK